MRVTTPVKDFTGIVVGVQFTDGAGDTDDPTALSYFRRHGYTIGGEETEATEDETPETPVNEEVSVAEETSDEDTQVVKPAGNASKQAWYEYALANGFDADELEGLDRNELRNLVAD